MPQTPYTLKADNPFYLRRLKKFVKNNKNLKNAYLETLEILKVNPNQPSLNLHPITKKDSPNLYSVRINLKYRILFILDEEQRIITLSNIGSHDDVY